MTPAARYRLDPRAGCGCAARAPLPPALRRRPALAQDRAGLSPRSAFIRAKKIEARYARQLRGVARIIADMLRGYPVADMFGASALRAALERYAGSITDWAQAAARRMVTEVAARDERAWVRSAQHLGESVRREIAEAPTGFAMRAQMAEQVRLIKSLPLEAAKRVHEMTQKGIAEGWRADQIADEIMRTGEITKSRATLIARTEVGRTATALTQARAEHIGSTEYIWRTAEDGDVRPSHVRMEGKTVRWDSPPTLDGMTGHAGSLPNCRCYCEPVLPADLQP